MLDPDSPSTDQLEVNMRRLLGSEKIDRFQSKHPDSMRVTCLIDLRGLDRPWSTTVRDLNKGQKRALDGPVGEEVIPIRDPIHKHRRLEENERSVQSSSRTPQRRAAPSNRRNKQTRATWTKKYNVAQCRVLLDRMVLPVRP